MLPTKDDTPGFFLQLRLLLWKNFTVKRRHPIALILEIIIPLVLFFILIGIRSGQKAKPLKEEHYNNKPLSSAGIIPVLQSFCRHQGNSDFSNNNTRLTSILENVQTFVEDMHKFELYNAQKSPKQLLQLPGTHGTDLFTWLNLVTSNNFTGMTLVELLFTQETDDEASQTNTSQATTDHIQPLDKLLTLVQSVLGSIGDIPSDNCDVHNNATKHKAVNKISSKLKDVSRFWQSIEQTVCGNDKTGTSQTGESINNKTSNADSLSSSQKQNLELITHYLYNNPKILYAPNNTAVNKIINKVNVTLSMYSNITLMAKRWRNITTEKRREYMDWANNLSHIIAGMPSSRLQKQFLHLFNTTSISKLCDLMDTLACNWLSLAADINFDVFHGFESEAKLEEYFLQQQFNDNVTAIAGVVFMNLNASSVDLPRHVTYKIRQNATLTPATNQVRHSFWYPSPGSNIMKYYNFGFVWIQDIIERAIIDIQTGDEVSQPGTYLSRMPYPCWLMDSFVWLLQHVLPLCLMLSCVYSVAMLVQRIVYEKEKRLKEVMKMMGLSNGVHWCGWFITAFIQLTITMATLTAMLTLGHILPYSDPGVIFIFLESFAVSSIALSCLISSLFSNAKLASACAGILYFLAYVPYIYITIREDVTNIRIPAQLKTLASICSTSAMGLGGKYFLFYELEGTGVQWSNMASSPREGDNFNLLIVLQMMWLDTIIYLVLTWYIENVHPGAYGLPKPWYFPFTQTYWCNFLSSCSIKRLFGIKDKITNRYVRENDAELITDVGPKFEPEPDNLPPSVIISNLTKIYEKGKPAAVNSINLTLYEGQITTLLGHNGAGKTTLMSILCGLFPTTSGTATIYGHDIACDMDEIRKNLGICPQHNVLFDSLTVEEHLWFYARLKGKTTCSIKTEMETLLKDVNLQKKRNCLPAHLSGGMQRKLSIAVAFVGGSKTVILDEPTAGVDPYSRRSIWNLIIKYKTDRAILLSTHHMDEAEILSDRVIIMSQGKLICSGSPLYLKSTLGDGLHLQILGKNKNWSTDSSRHILSKVQETIPSCYIKSTNGPEVHIILPIDSRRKGILVDLFDKLLAVKDELNVESYGIVNAGLEEIFIMVTKEMLAQETDSEGFSRQQNGNEQCYDLQLDDIQQGIHLNSNQNIHNNDFDRDNLCSDLEEAYNNTDECCLLYDYETSTINTPAKRSTLCKHMYHLRALLIKRLRYTVRNKKSLISQILLPVIFVTISMIIALSAPIDKDPPTMTLSTSQYYNLTKPRGNFIPYTYKKISPHSSHTKRSCNGIYNLVRTFKMPSGIGGDCVLRQHLKPRLVAEMIGRVYSGNHKSELLPEYFEDGCRAVFKSGLFVDTPVWSSNDIDNATAEEIYVPATPEKKKLYPDCVCKIVGFSCAKTKVQPPSYSVVTSDILQDISQTDDEENFYLYTTNEYKLHRYGGFSFDHELSYVPDTFGNLTSYYNIMRLLVVKDAIKVRFNHKGYHSIPIYINAFNNALLRANIQTSKGNPSEYGITLINHPIKKTNNILDEDYITGGTDVLMGIFIVIAMSFVPASFVVFLVHERSIKAKHLQFLSGVNPAVYWISNYLWDMCNYLIPAVFIIAVLLAFKIPAYVSSGNFEAVVSLFMLYGCSITSMMYPASFVFNNASVAYIVLIVINLFTGITCVMAGFILDLFSTDDNNLSAINNVLKEVFLLFPNYCLGNGLMSIALTHYKNEFYSHTGQLDRLVSVLSWDITGKRLLVMSIEGVVLFICTVLYEYRFFIRCSKPRRDPSSDENQDLDIIDSGERLMTEDNKDYLLNIVNLAKIYKRRRRSNILAVDNLNISVYRGECFGFLGVNGAGKTTTFKMLTGDIRPTAGDATLNNYSILSDMCAVHDNIGYCPQFDAMFNELTPTQHIQLYARLRGIPSQNEQKLIQHLLGKLVLVKYANQPVGTLSGGNKRKLSTAISLIGNPPLIYMDEPTTGMDPYSKRFVWDLIRKLVDEGKSIIFTSHSMEECEAICSRLSIMAEGQLKCQGTIQQLKQRYGNGYTLEVSVDTQQDNRTRHIREYIEGNIAECILKDIKHKTLVFEVKLTCDRISDVYRIMERSLDKFNIVDYSLSQNTLDNVFLHFARQQHDLEMDVAESSQDSSCSSGVDETSRNSSCSSDAETARVSFWNSDIESI